MTPEMLYNALLSFIAAVGWYWVRGIDKKQDEDKTRMDRMERDMRDEVRDIRSEYQRRDDAAREAEQTRSLLNEIKTDIRGISDKLDRKADK